MLYIVATPIGNLRDITLRAIETLKSVDFIIAENPRNSLKLLNHYEIPHKKILQFAEPHELKALPKILAELKTGHGALITDAGTPGISDPGFRLIRAAVAAGIQVIPIPGPSAEIAGLSASGLPTDRFMFVGFAPRTENKLIKIIQMGQDMDSTIVLYESPFRIVKSLEFIAKHFPDCEVVIAREVTKIHEEFLRGKPAELLTRLNKDNTRGEFTVMVSFKQLS